MVSLGNSGKNVFHFNDNSDLGVFSIRKAGNLNFRHLNVRCYLQRFFKTDAAKEIFKKKFVKVQISPLVILSVKHAVINLRTKSKEEDLNIHGEASWMIQ